MKTAIKITILILISFNSFGQSIVQRGQPTNTQQDARVYAQYNLGAPRFADTTAANLQKGIDSAGTQIYTRDVQGYWIRQGTPKRWVRLVSGVGGSICSVHVVDATHIQLCDCGGLCSTISVLAITVTPTTVYVLNDTTLVVCDSLQSCDTVHIPKQQFSIFQNGVVDLPNNIIEFGTNPLLHDTRLETKYNVFKLFGTRVYDYSFQFTWEPPYWYWQAGTGMQSWLGNSSNLDQIDNHNNVRLGVDYIGAYYDATVPRGYFKNYIGYTLGVNATGKGSYGEGVDNQNSKVDGIFIHTLDTTLTDAVTFYGIPPPHSVMIAPIANGVTLDSARILTLHNNLNAQWYGYKSNVRNDGETFKALFTDTNGIMKLGDVGTFTLTTTGIGAATYNKTTHILNIPAAGGSSTFTLVLTTNGSSGAATMSNDTLNIPNYATGGTLTNFAAGNLSPLFTTSVSNPTTSPSLSFSLSNANGLSFLGNRSSSSGAPLYNAGQPLSKTDDANVTLTLGGTYTSSLLQPTSLTIGWTGVLSYARGGTGTSSIGSAGQYVVVNAGGNGYTFITPPFISSITGDNGVTANTATNVRLGGDLVTNTTIGNASETHTLTLNAASYSLMPSGVTEDTTKIWAIVMDDATGQLYKRVFSGGGGGGGGGVSQVTSGNLSPLFTTSVANSTTTPAISYALSNASGFSYFGRKASSTGVSAYQSAGSLSKVDDSNVTLTLGGTYTSSLLQDVSLTLGWNGFLSYARGGTGTNLIGTAGQYVIVNPGATGYTFTSPTFADTTFVQQTVNNNYFNIVNNVFTDSTFVGHSTDCLQMPSDSTAIAFQVEPHLNYQTGQFLVISNSAVRYFSGIIKSYDSTSGILVLQSNYHVGNTGVIVPCGKMDVAFVLDNTGSMQQSIDSVKARVSDLATLIATQSGNDYRLALVTFKDSLSDLITRENFNANNVAAFQTALNGVVAGGGGNLPEGHIRAISRVVNAMNGFNTFRSDAAKIIIMITDAEPSDPSTIDGVYNAAAVHGVDTLSTTARSKGITISTIATNVASYLPVVGLPNVPAITKRWADSTGGLFFDPPFGDGSYQSFWASIQSIIQHCGAKSNYCTWTVQLAGGVTANNGLSIKESNSNVQLGGSPLIHNTIINGGSLYSFTMDSLRKIYFQADTLQFTQSNGKIFINGVASGASTDSMLVVNPSTGKIGKRPQGNQAITFTASNDINGSVTGTTILSPSLTINNNVVSNAKLATVSSGIVKGRLTAGTGNVEDVTLSQLAAVLYTASNGIVLSSGNFKLGGSLTENTNINSGAFGIFLGTASAVVPLNLSSSGNASADLLSTYSSTNTTENVLKLERFSTSAPANGIGTGISFLTHYTAFTATESGSIGFKWADVSARTSTFELYGYNSNTNGRKLAIAGNGQLTLDGYSGTNLIGSPTYMLGTDVSGNVVKVLASTTYTASNGITLSGSDFQLGGSLTKNTTITNGNFLLTLSGSNIQYTLKASNSTAGAYAIFGEAGAGGVGLAATAYNGSNSIGVLSLATGNGVGITSSTQDGYGVFASSTGLGTPVYGYSQTVSASVAGVRGRADGSGAGIGGENYGTGHAGDFTIVPTSTNTVATVLGVYRESSSAVADGVGGSIDFYTQTLTSGGVPLSNQLVSLWSTANGATRTSRFEIYGVNNAVTARKVAIAGSGLITGDGYGLGNNTGTVAYSLGVTSSGNFVEYRTGSNNSLAVVSDAAYTIGATETDITFVTLTANRAVNFPAASSYSGRRITVRNSNDSGGGWTVTISGTTLRDGAVSYLNGLSAGHFVTAVSDGTYWWITAFY